MSLFARVWGASKPRRIVVDREEYVSRRGFGFGHYSSETRSKRAHFDIDIPDFFGGPVISSLLVVLLVFSLLAVWMGYLCGVAAAVAALCSKLYVGRGMSKPR